MRAAAWLLVLSCGRPAPPGGSVDAATPAVPRAAATSRTPDGPVRDAPQASAASARAPQNDCAVRASARIDAAAHEGLAGYLGAVPFALSFGHDGRAVTLWTLGQAGPQRGWTRVLEAPTTRASLLCDAGCTLALIDTRAVLHVLAFELTSSAPPRVLARGVDRRFAPALVGRPPDVLVAYTATRDEVMHTLLMRAADPSGAPRDVTPEGHGAAAPTFVLGAAHPTLVMIDARAGLSPLLELTLDAQGTPSAVRVRTPVSQPSQPPLLAASVLRDGEIEVYYSLIGRLAMTAIGRVPLRRTAQPSPLLSSRGYGNLRFVAARSRLRTLVAFEVPSAPPPSSPRTLGLKLLDGERTDEVLALEGDRPSLASGPEPGSFVLVYASGSGLHASMLGCDDAP